MMSRPRCRKRSGSRMCSMFASDPVSRLSTQITRLPRASSSSQRCDPKKPAPPVTRQVAIAAQHTPIDRGTQAGPYDLGMAKTGYLREDRKNVALADDNDEHLTVAPIVGPDDPRRF